MAKKKSNNTSASATRARASRQAERQQRLKNIRTAPPVQSTQKVRKQAARRNTSWWWIGAIILACIIIVGVFVFISYNQKPAGVIGPTDQTVLKAVTTVKSSVLEDVNTGGLQNVITPIKGQPPLTGPNGKPEIFYYGAEFCPYCAADRWSMVVALSRFGTFSQLPQSLSSSTDTAPNTSTFTFVNSKYTSSIIDFVPLENEDRDGKPLQEPTAAQQQLLQTFKVTGYPFLDIGNRYQVGALYDPGVLANLSQKDIASKLSDPNDTVTKNIIGGANYLTAAICAVTNNQPADVCTTGPIPSIIQSLSQKGSVPINNQADIVHNLALIVDRRRV